MAITVQDIKVVRSFTVSDSVGNGGLPGTQEVLSGVRHSLFPRVSPVERAAGISRYRKAFIANRNSAEDAAYNVMAFLEYPSPAGDSFALAAATAKGDTKADISGGTIKWVGVGALAGNKSAGATTLDITMESTNCTFIAGGMLHISNKFLRSQTVAAGVRAGDSVTFANSSWNKIAPTNNTTWPNGIYCGSGTVATVDESTFDEWLGLSADALVWNGNVVTVTLAEPLVNSYLAANTYVSGVIVLGDITPTSSIGGQTGTGTYDAALFPLQLFNRSTPDDTFTVNFTSGTSFLVSGVTSGALGGGSINAAFTPVNGAGLPYFTIPAGFFTGTWQSGNTLTFTTGSASAPLWFRETVPPGTAENSSNFVAWGWYAE